MYQGRIVTIVPEGQLPPIGSTVVMNQQYLQKLGSPVSGMKNVIVYPQKDSAECLEGIEIGDQQVFVSLSLEGAICMDDREVFILGSLKLQNQAEKYSSPKQ